jgi:cell division protein FtsQ
LQLAGAGLTAWLIGLAWEHWPQPKPGPWFPVSYVRVQGEIENVDRGKLQEALMPALNGGYFSMDLGEIERAVRSLAWINGVGLRRVWPDTLEITVSEQKAVARWGDRALLNAKGERFAPGGIEAFGYLPVIYGPEGMEADLLTMLGGLNDRLAPHGVRAVALEVSKRRAWILKLNNGLALHLGRQEPLQAVERFFTLVPKLGEDHFPRLKSVDLRYRNGFAVVWKTDAEMGAETPVDDGAGL